MQPMTFDEFQEELGKALPNLYDLAFLETSPLTACIQGNASVGVSRGRALRKSIADAIESLRPPDGTPSDDAAWRPYRILDARYIAGLSHTEIEEELFLGKSQYYREHARAMEALSAILWRAWGLERVAEDVPAKELSKEPGDPDELALAEMAELVRQEEPRRVNLVELLGDIIALLASTGQGRDVRIVLRGDRQCLPVLGSPGALRQCLLLAISQTLSALASGFVYLDLRLQGDRATIQIKPEGVIGPDGPPSYATVGAFVRVAGGCLALETGCTPPSVGLAFPALLDERVALLVDNSSELADLFSRYLEDEPWTLVHARTAEQALEICHRQSPALILLDVLMPHRDGWDLLSQLKSAPDTMHIPVVICSVLNQPQLALSLGAVGYLRKPVSQESLRAALAQWGCLPLSAEKGPSARPAAGE